jgi:hypothetical protein
MNIQSTITAKIAITLLLKEVDSIRFDQNLPQERIDQQKSEEEEDFVLCGVVTVTFIERYHCL